METMQKVNNFSDPSTTYKIIIKTIIQYSTLFLF